MKALDLAIVKAHARNYSEFVSRAVYICAGRGNHANNGMEVICGMSVHSSSPIVQEPTSRLC